MKTLKIIKVGGEIVDQKTVLHQFLEMYAKLEGPKILVHGGGKLATELARKLHIPVTMVDGRRVTDLQTLEVATMVYAGKINKSLVAKLQDLGCNALGLSGADGNAITAVKRPVKTRDFGFVGDVVSVNQAFISQLLAAGLSPVFCAITHNRQGQLLNTNADTIASELAVALAAFFEVQLYYCFDKAGVLKDMNDDTSVLSEINLRDYEHLKSQKVISDGMIPKLDNCFYALNKGVKSVGIGNTQMLLPENKPYTSITI